MSKTFISYGDKSGAKRGFGRTYKDFTGNVEDYLDKVDGKWGFYKDEDGQPVLTNEPPPVAHAYKAIWPGSEPKKEEVAAEPEPELEPEPAITGSAFAAFAAAQLGGGAKPNVLTFTRAPAEPKVDRNRPENNGVKRPSEGTICAHVWSLATQLSAEKTAPAIATLGETILAAEAAGINKYTARTQYARWRVYNGHTGKK